MKYLIDYHPSEEEIQRIINEGDVTAARRVCMENQRMYKMFAKKYNNTASAGVIEMYMIQNGVRSLLDPEEIEKNWKLGETWADHSETPGCNWSSFRNRIEKIRGLKGAAATV